MSGPKDFEPAPVHVPTLKQDIEAAINRHSRENESNTCDFILAEYLMACLAAFEGGVNARDKWYGRDSRPGMAA